MTTTQALTGQVAQAPSAKDARPGNADRSDAGDASFGDTLDRAARSQDAKGRDAAGSAGRDGDTRERPLKTENGRRKGETENGGATDEDSETDSASSQAAGQGNGSDLALMIAALASSATVGVNGDGHAAAAGDDTAAQVVPVPLAGPAADAVPPLPGQGDDEPLDASQLLALLDPEAAPAEPADAEAFEDAGGLQLKATVAGQETHLAVSPPQTTAAEALLDARGTSATAPLAAEANAAQAASRSDGPGGARARSDGQSGSSSAAAATLSETAAVPVSEADQRSGNRSPDDQGLSGGQQSRHSDRGTAASADAVASSVFASQLQSTAASRADEGPQHAEPAGDQIAAEVRAELKADGMGESSSDGVTKVLHIELKPANLGAVTVRLSLKDNVINLHIEAQRRETVAVIEREREALVGALASAGYDVDRVTTAPQSDAGRLGAALPRVGEASNAGSSGLFQGQAGGGDGLANSSGRGAGGSGHSPDRPGYSRSSGLNDDGERASRSVADGLYV